MVNDPGFVATLDLSSSSESNLAETSRSSTRKVFGDIDNHALIYLNEINKPCNTDIFDDLTEVLAHKYDRDSLSITFPCFV